MAENTRYFQGYYHSDFFQKRLVWIIKQDELQQGFTEKRWDHEKKILLELQRWVQLPLIGECFLFYLIQALLEFILSNQNLCLALYLLRWTQNHQNLSIYQTPPIHSIEIAHPQLLAPVTEIDR